MSEPVAGADCLEHALMEEPRELRDIPAPNWRRLMAARLRLGTALVGLTWALIAWRHSTVLVVGLFLYVVIAALGLVAVMRGFNPRARVLAALIVDIAAITWISAGTGLGTSPTVIFYIPILAGYALQEGRAMGRVALGLSLSAYVLAVVLEVFAILPRGYLLPPDTPLPDPPGGFATSILVVVVAQVGTYLAIILTITRIEANAERERSLLVAERDAQQRSARLQRQLLEVERLESVGRLAGGIAHDFNNLLTGVIGYARFVKEELTPDSQADQDIDQVIHAARRARDLTAQLLDFSRKGAHHPTVLDPNALIRDLDRMLRRIIGEDLIFEIDLATDLGCIHADPAQLERIIVNMVVNSRDAMPKGGTLTMRTMNVTESDDSHSGDDASEYVRLVISDTGVGMDEATRKKVFEPFFTTKDVGKGTGLGLATVYGFVIQNGGQVIVESEPGCGTTFTIDLPRVYETPTDRDSVLPSPSLSGGTVLLVEDEDGVRGMAARVLRRNGLKVLEACNGPEALQIAESHIGTIDVLLSDVVMPGGSGPWVADELSAVRPGIRVAFMSGYSHDAIETHGIVHEDIVLLPKPFSPEALLHTVEVAVPYSPASKPPIEEA